jgi:hypothetical protein
MRLTKSSTERPEEKRADRAVGDAVARTYPAISALARQGRQFLIRSVRYLVAEAGVRQFLDLGSGIPTVGNVHEVAQQAIPEARVVYVDYEPLAYQHATDDPFFYGLTVTDLVAVDRGAGARGKPPSCWQSDPLPGSGSAFFTQ